MLAWWINVEKITVIPTYYQVQFWGADSDGEPIWDSESLFGRGQNAFLVSVSRDSGAYELEIHFGEEPSPSEKTYGRGEIIVDSEGIEISDVISSSKSGSPGFIGTIFPLTWIGKTIIDVVALGGFESNNEGHLRPKRMSVYIYPK